MALADVMSSRLVSVQPDETVHVAVSRMMEAGVGAIVVTEGTRLVGIFTERDLLRIGAESPAMELTELRVGAVMTTHLVTLAPDDDVLAAARLMGERRIRHVPIVEGDNVLGLVGIRDVMRSLVERIWRSQDDGARETARELLRG